jgi:hypothetical protein
LFFWLNKSNFKSEYTGKINMLKKLFLVLSILTFITACGGGGGSSSSSGSSSGSSGSGGAAQGYQVPGSFQPVDSEN